MKRIFAFFIVAACSLVLVSCGFEENTQGVTFDVAENGADFFSDVKEKIDSIVNSNNEEDTEATATASEPETTVWETIDDETLEIIPDKLYVRVATNLYESPDDLKLGAFVDYETALDVIEYKGEDIDHVYMWHVKAGDEEGWIRPWYVVYNEYEAKRPEIEYTETTNENGNTVRNVAEYPEGTVKYYYALHTARGDRWGGGDAADLDYYARDEFDGPEMPSLCKAIYLPPYITVIEAIDDYIETAKNSGMNAIVIDISDNTVIGFASETMKEQCPTAYYSAMNSEETFAEYVKHCKDAGFYMIARITAFHDDYLCDDHPDWAITDENGNLKNVTGGYWPTAFNRNVWEYKVALAKECVEKFGFDEIQWDYVRFPDRTYTYEKEGTIDFHNEYNESKAQAIERFLMYSVDVLHDAGANVSADVFGETSNDFVAQYGQYWPAISNVVDAISAMPYCDHYAADGDWYPWEHPYEIITKFANMAVNRQKEIPTPAVDRTWIQCYDSLKLPKVYYYGKNLSAQICALYDAGLTGGWITWNPTVNIDRYRRCEKAFRQNPGDKPLTED